ncbi:hypothetical protein BDB01DRAFT_843231 [Pilobolus umbonatus]|nr:hypothetical protein BDB01DRAFT_843231 [Pilobolus umbonatus]
MIPATEPANSIDDIWELSDNEDETTYDRNIAEKEWERLQEDHGNSGYKEGVVEGKEVNMQRGFDKGYIEGLHIGKAIGKLREVQHVFQVDYFRENGRKGDYVDPSEFVSRLEERVNRLIDSVSSK